MATKTNIEINGKDYFRVSCTIGIDSNGKRIRKTFYGKNKKEAEKKKNEYLNNIQLGLSPDISKIFLGSMMKTWLFEVVKVSNNIKPTTFERYEGIYRNYIKDSSIAALNLSSIKSIQIQRYYNDLYSNKDKKKSSSQIKTLNKLLKQFFNYAVEEGYILKNPCQGKRVVIPGNVEVNKKEVEVFTSDELKRIFNADENTLIKNMAIICTCTGMRRGECLGLNLSDIDEVNNTISIKRTVSTVTFIGDNGERTLKTIVQIPKTIGSIRTIPLPKSLIPIFKELKVMKKKNKLKAGSSYSKEFTDFIFLTESGNLIDDRNLSRAWKRFLDRINVDYKKFHALRHTYATKQFEGNTPLKTVSELLGHTDIYITANTYTHVLKEHKEKSIDIFSTINVIN
jgi:integrase